MTKSKEDKYNYFFLVQLRVLVELFERHLFLLRPQTEQ